MKTMSLQQVAECLDISRITISKVINNKPGVSEETRKRIIEKLIEIDYPKLSNELIKSIEDKRKTLNKKCIVVVATAPDFSDFWMKIINSISNGLSQSNYDVVYSFLPINEKENFVIPKIISSKEASGIIVINVYDIKIIESISNMNLPTVYLDVPPNMLNYDIKGDIILLEGTQSIFEITSHIIEKGNKNIGFIGDIDYAETIYQRFKGYKKAMDKYKLAIKPELCFTSNPNTHYYYSDSIEYELNKLEAPIDAFICANDTIAFMVIECLKKKGLNVPNDVLISGYDNIKENLSQEYFLTTASVDTNMLGKRLLSQLLLKMEDLDMPNEIITLKSQTIYRESTKDSIQ